MTKFKRPLLFALTLLPIALVAGIFVGFYQLDTLSEEMIDEVVAQVGSTDLLVAVGAVQTVLYALFCGFFGYLLAQATGLWKPFCIDKKGVLLTILATGLGGVLLGLDPWTFGSVIEGIAEADAAGLTVSGVIASVLYGGVIEEVMLRLFFMTLIAFLIWKLAFRKYDREHIPVGVFIAANVVSALAFAAGHLPATIAIFGELTPLILFRCFLFNGGLGLFFGYLYRKHGIVYAMAAHAICHIVSKLIWWIFL